MGKTLANAVELNEAQDRILRWREYVGSEFETKAFFIALDDIRDLYEELVANGGYGIRAYLARREALDPEESPENELLIVGVRYDPMFPGGSDVLEIEGQSKIYDFTSPCPRMCAEDSQLFTLSKNKQK